MSTLVEAQTKQLKGILEEFNLGDVKTALGELVQDKLPHGIGWDDKVMGKKCKKHEDGCVDVQEYNENLEAVWDEFNLLPAHFLTEGAQVQKAVAMVTLKEGHNGLPAGNGWGTGFLISNSLFMTNNHVIANKDFCDKVNMQFMYQDNYNSEPDIPSEFFETNEDSFFHTNATLDYTIVRLKRKPYFLRAVATPSRTLVSTENGHSERYAEQDQIEELKFLNDVIARKKPITALDPQRIISIFGYTPGSKYGFVPLRDKVTYPVGLRLNIIQHPQGRRKEVVVQQNKLNDVHTNVIHYFSDTDYGSSGSPVFDNKWDLMALHHARHPAESANEGIRIDKIVADLRNEFGSSNPAILTELGI
ncbi:serine protease [Marinoscillum sp. MHG1-6]|uniref:trypsin-like serine peptidase n=1 Tax=Marinoscillum sp. MHG1-6 TaxID=2959627 RepID=UPI002157BA80|nr:serine protease [Marinoscillum sp. MHG1-6]